MLPKKEIKNTTPDISTYIDYMVQLGLYYDNNADHDLLYQAFVNKTYSADKKNLPHNQRLEFLGDAVLWQIISYQLYQDFPSFEESDLTLRKIWLVREETLAKIAKKIWLDKMILLGNWEEKKWWRDNSSILCDSVESIIWYIYIDLWYNQVRDFVIKYIYSELPNLDLLDTKSYRWLLQELIQSKYKKLPIYEEIEVERDDKKNYVKYRSQIYVDNNIIWSWYGTSKKKSQEDAAKNAYNEIKNIV